MTAPDPRFVRTVDGATVQTAVASYRHPASGRSVTVIGAALYADSAYFTVLQEVVDTVEAAGAVVQCAGSRWLPDDLEHTTTAERDLVAAFDHVEQAERRQMRAHGLVGLEDALTYRPQWQIADLSVLAMIRVAGARGIHAHIDRAARLFDFPLDDVAGPGRVRRFAALVWQHTSEDWQLDLLTDTSGPAAVVLLQSRIALALIGLDTTDADLVMVRPVTHTPGLHAGLLRLGYEGDDTATRWITVTGNPSTEPGRAGTAAADQEPG